MAAACDGAQRLDMDRLRVLDMRARLRALRRRFRRSLPSRKGGMTNPINNLGAWLTEKTQRSVVVRAALHGFIAAAYQSDRAFEDGRPYSESKRCDTAFDALSDLGVNLQDNE